MQHVCTSPTDGNNSLPDDLLKFKPSFRKKKKEKDLSDFIWGVFFFSAKQADLLGFSQTTKLKVF